MIYKILGHTPSSPSFLFLRDVLDQSWDLIGSVSEDFPTYIYVMVSMVLKFYISVLYLVRDKLAIFTITIYVNIIDAPIYRCTCTGIFRYMTP